jgi:hypothetical protein
MFRTASHTRNWNDDQRVLADTELKSGAVRVINIRDNTYRSPKDYDSSYLNQEYKLSEAVGLWLAFELFYKPFRGAAHSMLSFEFTGDRYLVVSVECRKEKGDTYSPFRGMLGAYEIIYVVATEADLIMQRTHVRKNPVYLYPVNTTKEKIAALFVEVMSRVRSLHRKPELYNTLWRSCTTTLVKHVRTISPGRIPFSPSILVPGYSDRRARDIGLVGTGEPIAELREKHLITPFAQQFTNRTTFSQDIRQGF